MFEIYKNNHFVMYYENLNKSFGFTHSLTVKNLLTNETTGMWVDPTHTSTDAKLLDKILRLQQLKETMTQDEYEHEVACFIERLIENGGYTCLEISSLMKDALKHHKDPQHLLETIKNVDVSYIRNQDIDRFHNIQEMKNAVAGFIKTLTEFICNLLSLPSDNSVTSILVKFNIYQNPIADEEIKEPTNFVSSMI
ncbi:hypothetical protein OQJ19_15545 [Fluoribacter gormanii]|uniref:Uncharacterized protein n=1 Tax=Fluoribacter gormanii TaxID=464 RepID=A0A377GJQ3_9GAMM|nr:hypothetical protein [Fluoribacter gormanii]KTD01352.1 hypothetical protein Lgor_2418 [Fluoribacter gormanii]MCW8472046.1 hypothetical protein [Fluoribacter gormanii]SIR48490.1 hypothetical protein SAMN05421777_11358 [Fluoribacter gormanii]STO24834.1 Uncharacterised protein [Fluoribacter gormanii]